MTAEVDRKIHSKISEAYLQFFPKLLKFSEIGRENEGWKSPVFCFNWSVIPGPACDSWTISQRTSSNFCTVTTLDWEMAELDVLFCRNHLPAAPQICLHFCQEKIFNLKIEKQGILIFYAATLKYKNHIYCILVSRSLKDKCCGRGGSDHSPFPTLYYLSFLLTETHCRRSETWKILSNTCSFWKSLSWVKIPLNIKFHYLVGMNIYCVSLVVRFHLVVLVRCWLRREGSLDIPLLLTPHWGGGGDGKDSFIFNSDRVGGV